MKPAALRAPQLPSESDFYAAYDWSLDPHLTCEEAIDRLAHELDRLPDAPPGWQRNEIATNVYLLSCSLLNGVDVYLRGPTLRLPAQVAQTRVGRIGAWTAERGLHAFSKRGIRKVRRWRQDLQGGLDAFVQDWIAGAPPGQSFAKCAESLVDTLQRRQPSGLLSMRLGIPSAFSRLDFSPQDVLALGREFARQYPDRSRPILLLGLRTAGTYLAMLLSSYLKTEGYQKVAFVTVHPKKGPGRQERMELRGYSRRGFTAVIVDDPPKSGATLLQAMAIARRAGFDAERIRFLLAVESGPASWRNRFPDGLLITLEEKDWQKHRLVDGEGAEARLTEYFFHLGYTDVAICDRRRLDEPRGDGRGIALKRIFEVQLRTWDGAIKAVSVLAEGVGAGYLGYPAFLAAQRLSEFVPPLLGLRDGVLYSELFPHRAVPQESPSDREKIIERTAAYLSARTRLLSLPKERKQGKAIHENGVEILSESLSRAYGRLLTDVVMRSQIKRRLCRLPCPVPTLVDGNMDRDAWIEGPHAALKTGYHREGLGKTKLNLVDPAYDVAETILAWDMSAEEEERLIGLYAKLSGDVDVRQRLFVNKLLAGAWTIKSSLDGLFQAGHTPKPRIGYHRRYLQAWEFLTFQSARFSGRHFGPPRSLAWRSPLVVLDVDGVIDRRLFGWPCTTAEGIEALSLLSEGGFSVALNTARSLPEVKEYCRAYGLVGGVAEHGAYLWDAVADCGHRLVDEETLRQFDAARQHLEKLPGVFLDHRHCHSIRAYAFEQKSGGGLLFGRIASARNFGVGDARAVPLPPLLVSQLLSTLRLDRLSFHNTMIDTAIVARTCDKGTGLAALRDLLPERHAETAAVGDSEHDLAMFCRATRSFAPAHISCRREAALLGCTVLRRPHQRGLLEAVRKLVDGPATPIRWTTQSDGEALFAELLQAAGRRNLLSLARALVARESYGFFIRE
jgi:hydroxymethylpyrimidine pyrophosphatase-like HAD family hydrolase/adenine/guanine phosphoribosyltransferase-like PRPP-binding protein